MKNKTNTKDCIIPMDDAIRSFKQHLRSHPRTILSAKFGDGKSFFLAAAGKSLRNKYVFIKIYPVNYQVAENRDIFELIKRDLLFQLYGEGLVPDSYEMPDTIASIFFIQQEWKAFAEDMLKCLSYLDVSNSVKVTIGAMKFLLALKKKYEVFKENGGELGSRLEDFLKKLDSQGIYEQDVITSIICDIIKSWKKKNPRKKICIVFEDMDRIDPAHIFRILNVISAHMDYGYKYGYSPNYNSLMHNKFDVDNIVVCLDYDNLKTIYQHFYGIEACFEGYIRKFTDRGYFRYSLKEQLNQFYINELVRVSGMKEIVVKSIISSINTPTKFLASKTLRQLFHATRDVQDQICLPKGVNGVLPHRGMFVIAAVLRRLDVEDQTIINAMGSTFYSCPKEAVEYVGSCMMLTEQQYENFLFSFGRRDRYGRYLFYRINGCNSDGTVLVEEELSISMMYSSYDSNALLEYILHHVSR